MNKLLVSGIINLKNDKYNIDIKDEEITINIEGNVTLYILDSSVKKIVINMNDDSTLNIYKFDKDLKNNIDIIINENNNTNVNFNGTFINNMNVTTKMTNYIKGNNNNSNINIRNVSNKNNSSIIVDVIVEQDTFNNTALEDLKGLNNGGFIHIEPNIICKSNEVIANHLTTIGTFDQNVLEYLMSKGLNEQVSKDLLLKGFICSNMNEDIKKLLGGE